MLVEEKNLPFQFKDKALAQNLLQKVNELLKDSDAKEEKEAVKNFLQKVSESITFLAVGDAGIGKTTFLNNLFDGVVCKEGILSPTLGISEIKGGAQEAEISVNPFYNRRFVTNACMEGISIVDTQGLDI